MQGVRPLEFRAGYTPARAKTDSRGGLIDAVNCLVEDGGRKLRPAYGSDRLGSASIVDGGSSNALYLVKFDPSIVGIADGVGLAVIDQAAGNAVLGLSVHRGQNVVAYTGGNADIQALVRIGAGSRVSFVQLQTNTYISVSGNPVHVFDGEEARLAGIRPPRRALSISGQPDSSVTVDTMDAGWVAGATPISTVSHDAAIKKQGAASMKCVQTSVGQSVLAKKAIGGVAVPAPNGLVPKLGIWMMVDRDLAAGTLSIRLIQTSPALTKGGQIAVAVVKHRWHLVQFDVSEPGGFTIDEAQLRIVSLTQNLTPLTIWIDDMVLMEGVKGEMTGTYRAVMTWVDEARFGGRESDPSPVSVFHQFNEESLVFDPGGQTPEDPARVTLMRIYVQKDALGANFHRVFEGAVSGSPQNITVNDDMLLAGAILTPNFDVFPGCELAIADGNRLLMARQPDHADGLIDVVQNSRTITGHSSDPNKTNLKRWMEGLPARIGASEEIYSLLEVDEGAQTALIVRCSNRDGKVADIECGYDGSTDTDVSYEIHGLRSRIWYSSFYTTREGILVWYSEGMTFTNQVKTRENDGQEIVALGNLGSGNLILKTGSAWYLRQNHSITDDSPNSPAFNAPVEIGKGGCVSGRSLAITAADTAYWLGPDNTIMSATEQGGASIWGDPFDYGPLFEQFTAAQIADAVAAFSDRLGAYIVAIENKILFVDIREGQWATLERGAPIKSLTVIKGDDGEEYIVAGNDNGWLERMFPIAGASGWMRLSGDVVFTATGGDGTTADVSGTLPATDTLIGVPILKIAALDGAQEVQRATANTTGQVTVAAWTTAAVAGDTIIPGGISWRARFEERRYMDEAWFEALVDLDADYTSVTQIAVKMYGTNGVGRVVDYSVVAAQRAMVAADFDCSEVDLGGIASKSLGIELSGVERGDAFVLRGLRAREIISERDGASAGRGSR